MTINPNSTSYPVLAAIQAHDAGPKTAESLYTEARDMRGRLNLGVNGEQLVNEWIPGTPHHTTATNMLRAWRRWNEVGR